MNPATWERILDRIEAMERRLDRLDVLADLFDEKRGIECGDEAVS